MTPKFTYDQSQHCLREMARMEEPIAYCIGATLYVTAIDLAKNRLDWHAYKLHLASLRVIKCFAHSWWTEGDYVESVSFEVIKGIDGERAIPKDHKQPRLYTQAEAEEIWNAGFNRAVFECSPHNGKQPDKQQYFKTRFNVEL